MPVRLRSKLPLFEGMLVSALMTASRLRYRSILSVVGTIDRSKSKRLPTTRVSDRKLRPKPWRRAGISTFDCLVFVAFFVSLMLFLCACSGSRVPNESDIKLNPASPRHVQFSRYRTRGSMDSESSGVHEHHIVDPDGSYSHSVVCDIDHGGKRFRGL